MLSVPAAGLLLFLGLASPSGALYFHIGETERRCFIEEIPDDTMVIGKYQTQLWDKQTNSFLPSTPGLGMHVEIKDPDTKLILSRQYGSDGRFTFTSHTPGEHQICLHSNSTKMALFAGGKLRVHLDIQVGEHTNNYPEIAAKDKLTELQLRARQLLDQVEQIQKEQNYQRYREERFRMTSESTNQRVLWWSIAQTLILILTGVWQMKHLKSFFEAKKLVELESILAEFGGKAGYIHPGQVTSPPQENACCGLLLLQGSTSCMLGDDVPHNHDKKQGSYEPLLPCDQSPVTSTGYLNPNYCYSLDVVTV